MPHFYFHLSDGAEFVEDDEGAQFPDADAARRYAISNLRQVAAADVAGGHVNTELLIEIANDLGCLVGSVRFDDAVRLVSDLESSQPNQ